MTDRIFINDLRFFGFHGVLPEEAVLGQRFRVDITAELDLAEAGRTDDLTKTVHYGEMAVLIEEIGRTHRYKLIEALAEAIAKAVFETYPPVERLTVRVTKPEAPVPLATGVISIEIERERPRD
ncbi:dihydroneopterin aldolase [Kaistia nematophila]|uniref:7,8-dihydroneopterin aldolase n=1 Tax=Kaistia nematophila TaxID=2994654 RepID=A0A9X3IL49_9HYPH|nr:dihydroneopterin aldolase [Kaistia nematophila]MCX5569181.1 dihydroneopterin aldolase [Kaistia nematophila]